MLMHRYHPKTETDSEAETNSGTNRHTSSAKAKADPIDRANASIRQGSIM
jgi:hypothetical protein